LIGGDNAALALPALTGLLVFNCSRTIMATDVMKEEFLMDDSPPRQS
jgi:hypothetical protein